MIARLVSPEYWAVGEPGPLGSWWIAYLVLGIFFSWSSWAALKLLLGSRRRSLSTASRAWAWYEICCSFAGLAAIAGRFLAWPAWSARIWPLLFAAMSLAGHLARRFRVARLPNWLELQLAILALAPPQQASTTRPRPALLIAGIAAHLLGMTLVVCGRFGLPWWVAPLALAVMIAPQAPLIFRRRQVSLMALTPLLAAYGATLLWLLYRALGITIVGWQGVAFPNPMLSLFYLDGIILASVAHSLLCQISLCCSVLGKPSSAPRWAALALLAAALAWTAPAYFGKRTHGATASDPYAYAQMGVDLAERGTFLHRFPLFEEVIPLQIAWAPLQPVGYHIPRSGSGDCPSVWATGASVLLAAGYQLLGEAGLYVTTPIVALLALAATWALAQEILRGEPRPVRLLVGAIAVALTATSPEHVDRLLVPMADAAAQLFTTLTLVFALRAMHNLEGAPRKAAFSMVLAGISFAWAYWVRHTQLVLVLPVALAVMPAAKPRKAGARQTVGLLLIFFASALLAALPDVLYRWRVFGGILATETTELPAMGLSHVGVVARQVLSHALVAGEWGYLFPLAAVGAGFLAKRHRREAVVLGSAFAAVLLVHLPYQFLRLRDLISIFPLVNLAVGYGTVSLLRWTQDLMRDRAKAGRLGTALLSAALTTWIVLSLALSRWAMIDDIWKPGWASFGYVRAEQRAAFDRLAALTPSQAVIGASLNAGAITLYSARDTIRPYDTWTAEEWQVFLDAMQTAGRPVYLLDDGALMEAFIQQEGALHQLTPIEALPIPVFDVQDRETAWLYRLEWDR